MEWFLRSNSTTARLLRTVVQGLLSVLITEIPEIVGLFNIPEWAQALIAAVLMGVLSAVMSELGRYVEQINGRKRLQAAASLNIEDQEEIEARKS